VGDEREVAGFVDSVDDEGVARLLLGTEDEEWFFPLHMLPPGTSAGDTIRFTDRSGHLVVIGKVDAPHGRSIEERLSRRLTKHTAELDLEELEAMKAAWREPMDEDLAVTAGAGAVSGPATPRPPVRTRASRQRRW
jgi:hypothetical protein